MSRVSINAISRAGLQAATNHVALSADSAKYAIIVIVREIAGPIQVTTNVVSSKHDIVEVLKEAEKACLRD